MTRFFEQVDDPAEAVQRINSEADVVWVDGHSDYGHAFGIFYDRWAGEVTSRTSVLVLGDARNNYHATEDWVLGELRRKARKVYWLNPERLLGLGRLGHRHLRGPLRRGGRVPDTASAREVRRRPGVGRRLRLVSGAAARQSRSSSVIR